ncbi:hypothetical protein [Rhabdothermincola sediminis]|uniref:hypothetical protein n=1 Tax=Rhabdothermincola sediminis TaxID=2751370 RepID=UPI001AA0245C|nr:hypothetical protein [Rhabdothermincola sediminis]
MPKLIFEADTQQELVAQVKRWLASLEAGDDGTISVSQAITQGAELTKDALRIIAAAAPKPVAQNELVKSLTAMGYKATDATSRALVEGLDTMEALSGGSVLRQVSEKGRSAVYQMNVAVAKQVLKTLTGGS